VAAATVTELSEPLLALAGRAAGDLAHIFPLVTGDEMTAALYCWGVVEAPAIELLSEVAAVAWRILPAPEPAELVQIAEAPPVASEWDRLGPEQQRIHLRAQRFARVQAAEMRLAHAEELRSGRVRGNLYDALREPIERARAKFHDQFFAACPGMVDYLHLELVASLAQNDADLLGANYPGPLV
jgi:hypothetical protein